MCFMDLNAEVLAHVTRPNLALNHCPPSPPESAHPYERPSLICPPPQAMSAPLPLLVSGDWADASRMLRRHWWVGVCVWGGAYVDYCFIDGLIYTWMGIPFMYAAHTQGGSGRCRCGGWCGGGRAVF